MKVRWSLGSAQGKRKSTTTDYLPPSKRAGLDSPVPEPPPREEKVSVLCRKMKPLLKGQSAIEISAVAEARQTRQAQLQSSALSQPLVQLQLLALQQQQQAVIAGAILRQHQMQQEQEHAEDKVASERIGSPELDSDESTVEPLQLGLLKLFQAEMESIADEGTGMSRGSSDSTNPFDIDFGVSDLSNGGLLQFPEDALTDAESQDGQQSTFSGISETSSAATSPFEDFARDMSGLDSADCFDLMTPAALNKAANNDVTDFTQQIEAQDLHGVVDIIDPSQWFEFDDETADERTALRLGFARANVTDTKSNEKKRIPQCKQMSKISCGGSAHGATNLHLGKSLVWQSLKVIPGK
ncbi:MAG: hypothetical protein SGPRY_003718 [Prymnesium sp.]